MPRGSPLSEVNRVFDIAFMRVPGYRCWSCRFSDATRARKTEFSLMAPNRRIPRKPHKPASATIITVVMAHARGSQVGHCPGFSIPGGPGLRLVDFQRAAAEVRAVQRLHGARCIIARHFDEAEATGLAGGPVHHQSN